MPRFGLFGTGHWATVAHAAAIEAHPEAQLVGVWGRDPAKAALLAGHHGVPAFAEVDELIAASDVVAVALPPDVQAGIAVRAARAGRHLLLDKPLALGLPQAQRVVDAAQETGVASVIFFTNRFHPDIAGFLAATAATGGWHGVRATMLSSIFQPGGPFEGSRWRREHGALWDLGPHALSLILPVLGPVTGVAALDGPDGAVHLLLGHAGSAASTLSLALDAPPAARIAEFVFYGEEGVSRVPPAGGSVTEALTLAIDQLLEEIGSGTRDHRCDARFGRDVVAVLAAAEEARAQGRTVAPAH